MSKQSHRISRAPTYERAKVIAKVVVALPLHNEHRN
jgi:hypothetical protein